MAEINNTVTRRTKIVATIGPASGSPELLAELITAGMNVARLNLSHGSLDTHIEYISNVRAVSERLGFPVAILIDLPGPKYRTGAIEVARCPPRKRRRHHLDHENRGRR